MRLAAARAAQAMSQGMSPGDSDSEGDQGTAWRRMSFVMGVFTTLANRKRRDSIRQTWMPQGRCLSLPFCTVELLFHFFFGICKNVEPSVGDQLRRLEDKGVVIRFVVGRRYGLVLSRR